MSDGWVYAVSGRWRLACNTEYGGSFFSWWVDGFFQWCIVDEQPPKHVQRRLLQKVMRKIKETERAETSCSVV